MSSNEKDEPKIKGRIHAGIEGTWDPHKDFYAFWVPGYIPSIQT